MKIAFVNQPIDIILLPYQSSIGGCTYGAANSLSKSCEVVVYGTSDRRKDFLADFREQNVHFRFFWVPLSDRLAQKAREKYSKLFPLSSPASSSQWLVRSFSRQVHPFYADEWIPRLKAKLSLAAPDAGTYLAHLKERLSAEASRKVAFLGFIPRPKLVDLYHNADVFAFAPIWDEGFGVPPVEAMTAGVPVVATRSGAIPAIVRDQPTGFLVGKNDPRALAEKLFKVMSAPLASRAACAIQHKRVSRNMHQTYNIPNVSTI